MSAGIVSIASGLWPFDRMWKLSRHTSDASVVGEADDAGRRLVAVDEAAPRERLVGDAHAESLGEIAELTQLGRRELLVAAARRRDIAAQEHGLDAETVHERELRRGSPQVLLEQVGADAFEVAERLVEIERQTELARLAPGSPRASAGEATRSGSKISTPSNPASRAATSF